MKRAWLALLGWALLCCHSAFAADTSLPLGTGLPLVVRTGVHFLAVGQIDDSAASFDATVDVRLIWDDLRLSYPAAQAPSGYREFRGESADEMLEQIWYPRVRLANLLDDAAFSSRGLRLYPNGRVELLQRTKGRFATPFDVERFPFDRQRLALELVSHREPASQVALDFRQADLEFGRVAKSLQLAGWRVGVIDIQRLAEEGWHGEVHSRLFAALQVARDPASVFAPIFIPLFASLLIPLLALWLNRTEPDGEFRVEAFELTNVLIGGLFALIALNFTVNSAYPMLSAGNPVALLFGLNYLLLAVNLAINILLMRFGLAKRWFGPHVQIEVYACAVWAMPAAVVVAVAAILLRAMV